ncbi:MAG: carboxymuconolactone decarboxylase family protein [Candidatus Ranarchaeia archaeon]
MNTPDKLELIQRLDPKLRKTLLENQFSAYSDGALPAKFKLLIAMALDAIHQSPEGVRVLAEAALEKGATWKEIAEVLSVVYYNCGGIPLYTVSDALTPLFETQKSK